MSVHWVYQATKVKNDSTTGDAENDPLPSISKVVLPPLQIQGTLDAHMPFQRRCSQHPFTILNTPLTSYTKCMGINVGVQIFMDFMGSSYSWNIKFYIHYTNVIRLYHENINLQNHLSFPNHENLNPRN